jgi:hypothetical protein
VSYYAFDQNGYLGDAASIEGWNAFASWARQQGGALQALAEDGYFSDAAALAAELARSFAGDVSKDAESVRAELAQLARKAEGVFIISDNELEAPD